MVPCAYLRAFEPVDALPVGERDRWRRYVAAGAGITVTEALRVEEQAAAARLLTGRAPKLPDVALVRREGARMLVCPLQLELRSALALYAFRSQVPDEIVEAFQPGVRTRAALAAPARPPHIREAAWAVPLEWYALFTPDDRHAVDPPEGAGPHVVYLTPAAAAASRLAHVRAVVSAGLDEEDELHLSLADLDRWLTGFHADTLLELDYGRLVNLFSPDELAQERTCSDVWQAVDSLENGDLLGAAAFYGVARSRWAGVRERQHAN